MKRLTAWFFQGLLFVAPIAVTVWVFVSVFMWIDTPLGAVLQKYALTKNVLPGVGFILAVATAVVVTTFVGFLSSNLLTRGFMQLLDRQFGRFPIVKLLHASVKDVVGAFVGKDRKFEHPVLVCTVPGSDVKLVGFVTRHTLEMWDMADSVAVYVPMAFNLGGNLIVAPRERVTPLEQPASEVMTFVMSGGVAGSPARPPAVKPPEGA
jgi:uncharacterized membrane protein